MTQGCSPSVSGLQDAAGFQGHACPPKGRPQDVWRSQLLKNSLSQRFQTVKLCVCLSFFFSHGTPSTKTARYARRIHQEILKTTSPNRTVRGWKHIPGGVCTYWPSCWSPILLPMVPMYCLPKHSSKKWGTWGTLRTQPCMWWRLQFNSTWSATGSIWIGETRKGQQFGWLAIWIKVAIELSMPCMASFEVIPSDQIPPISQLDQLWGNSAAQLRKIWSVPRLPTGMACCGVAEVAYFGVEVRSQWSNYWNAQIGFCFSDLKPWSFPFLNIQKNNKTGEPWRSMKSDFGYQHIKLGSQTTVEFQLIRKFSWS